MGECCKAGFLWNGTPTGKETMLGKNKAYVAGINKDVAVLIVHDVFGWTWNNARLLADHYAKEADTTVYLPDFFDGEVVPPAMINDPEQAKNFDLMGFISRHSKEKRFPEIAAAATALKKELGFKKVGAIGFCYGGWAVFRLGAKSNPLVDCISTAHPSLSTKEEVEALGVPTQIIAPETDTQLTPEMKDFVNKTIPTLGLEYDYQYFPGLVHGFATRGDHRNHLQKNGLERAKNVAVNWLIQYLH